MVSISSQHWSGVNLPWTPNELWPIGRSFHVACSLLDPTVVTPPHTPSGNAHAWLPCPTPDLLPSEPTLNVDPKVLVLWGMDSDGIAVSDIWKLNVNSLTWNPVHLPEGVVTKRIWPTAAAHYISPCETAVVTFGGGGSYEDFRVNDIHEISRTQIFHCGA